VLTAQNVSIVKPQDVLTVMSVCWVTECAVRNLAVGYTKQSAGHVTKCGCELP
jgi:hypothetical protein